MAELTTEYLDKKLAEQTQALTSYVDARLAEQTEHLDRKIDEQTEDLARMIENTVNVTNRVAKIESDITAIKQALKLA